MVIWIISLLYMLAYIVFGYLNYLTTLYACLYSIRLFELSHYLICLLLKYLIIWIISLPYMLTYIVFGYLNYLTTLYGHIYKQQIYMLTLDCWICIRITYIKLYFTIPVYGISYIRLLSNILFWNVNGGVFINLL